MRVQERMSASMRLQDNLGTRFQASGGDPAMGASEEVKSPAEPVER